MRKLSRSFALRRSSSNLEERSRNTSLASSDVERQNEKKEPPIIFWWKIIVMASCLIAVVTDPLFLYIPFINEERKCLRVDKRLRIIALILWSVTDVIFIIDIVYQVHKRMKTKEGSSTSDSENKKKQAKDERCQFHTSILIHILALLPLTQISILVIFFRIREARYLRATKALNIFLLLQYVPNILRVRHAYKELEPVHKFVSGAFNFLLYVLASHIIGAFWYYFSVKREISCWLQACKSIARCIIALCGGDSTPTYDISLDRSCPISPSNATIFDFGMYLDTIQSGYATQKTSPSKVFYYFWWGLKNLSNFGTNLQTSSYIWENCFAILISITGLLLFLYLIGNVQTYMNFSKSRQIQEEDQSTKKIEKENDIHRYVEQIKGLPQHEKSDIIANIRSDALKTKLASDVDMDLLLSIVHINTAKKITLLIGKNAMDNVKELQNMDADVLENMCEHLVPISYSDGYQFKTNSAIDKMLFIIRGEIFIENQEPAVGVLSASQREPSDHPNQTKLDCYGSELLWSASPKLSCSNLTLKLDRTITCKGKVEAFSLPANDLKTVVKNFSQKWNWSMYRCDIESPHMSNLICPREMNDDTSKEYIKNWKDELIKQQRVNIRNDIEKWLMSTRLGDDDVQRKIKDHIEKIDVEEKKQMGPLANLDIIFPLLSRDIQSNIAMNALKRMEFFKGKPDDMLEAVSKCLKPKIFHDDSHIAKLEAKLDSILYVVEGFIGCTNVSIDAARTSGYIPKLYVMQDTVFGENLLSWASTPSNTIADIPLSAQEFKCFGKVQAFILKVPELKDVASKFDKWAQVFSTPDHERKTSLQIMKDVHEQLNDAAWKDIGNEDFKKLMKFISKEKELLDWLSEHISSEDLITRVMKNIKENKVVEEHQDLRVDLKYLFCLNLSSAIQKDIVNHLCSPILKKVDLLKDMPAILKSICDNLKPMVYQNNDIIVGKERALEMILIIINGQIKLGDDESVSSSHQAVPKKTRPRSRISIYFEDDLLKWFSFENTHASSDPMAPKSVQCVTKVEAFVLPISILRSVLSNNINEWISNFKLLNKKNQMMPFPAQSDEIVKAKETKIDEWLSKNRFSRKLRKYFWFHVRLNNSIINNIDAEIDLEYIISSLNLPPMDIIKPMRVHLCMDTLRKVLMVKVNHEKILEKMCSQMEAKVYKEKEKLVGKGEPMEFVFVIVEGVIEWTVVSDDAESKPTIITKTRGDFFGKSLLNWASAEAMSVGEAPTATRDVICQTKVEVFRLSTNHLKSVVSEDNPSWTSIIAARKAQQQKILNEKIDKMSQQNEIDLHQIDSIEDKELRKGVKNKIKQDNILKWMLSNGLSEELKKLVKSEIEKPNALEQLTDVNPSLKFMLSIKGEDGQITKSMTECLCISLLRKVPMLERMNEVVLKKISGHVEAVYINAVVKKGELSPYVLVNKGATLPFVFFIVEGEIECTNNTSEVEIVTDSHAITKQKGDFFGEELVNWASPDVMFVGYPPTSTVDVKCRQKVQGFKLTAEKLRQVVYEHKREWDLNFTKSRITTQQLERYEILRANTDKLYKQMQLGKSKLDDIEDTELRKAVKIKIKENDIDKWMSDNDFSEELKKLTMLEIRKKNAIEWDIDTDMYLKFLLSLESRKNKKKEGSREKVTTEIIHHFCFVPLKKVPMLGGLQENVFRKILDKVEGFFLDENEYVVKKDEVIPFVLIIVEGVIQCIVMTNEGSDEETKVTLKKGDIYGEKLLNHATPEIMFSESKPTSSEDVICRKKLQGFKLTSASLKEAIKDSEVERRSDFGTKDHDSLASSVIEKIR